MNKAIEKEAALFWKVEEAYLVYHKKGHLLDKLNMSELQDIVRFLCYVEKKGKGDTYPSHNGSKRELKERIAEVKPLWAKYLELPLVAKEEDSKDGDDKLRDKELEDLNEHDNGINDENPC